jgi:hypothetical protein
MGTVHLRVVITHNVLPPDGLPMDAQPHVGDNRSLAMRLQPFEMLDQLSEVRITPLLVNRTMMEPVIDQAGEEAGEHVVRYGALGAIEAQFSCDVDEESGKIDAHTIIERGLAALRRTLRQLRAVTGIVDIDIHVGSYEFKCFREDGSLFGSGTQIFSHLQNHFAFDLSGVGYLEPVGWNQVAAALGAGEDTTLDTELETEARRFFRAGNYNMAVAHAAIGCDRRLYDLIVEALTDVGSLSRNSAEKFAREVSNRELPQLLPVFYDVPDRTVDDLHTTFLTRNEILHGRRSKPATRRAATTSIRALRSLKEASPKQLASSGA